MAKSGSNQRTLVEAGVAAVLRTTSCLQSLRESALLPVRRRRNIRQKKKSRPKEITDSALRSSPEAGARSIVECWYLRLWLLSMSWSGQTCPALKSVSPSGDTNKYTDVPNHRSHSERLTRSKRTRTGSHAYTAAVASEINYRCARV
jgi:hypothetical protein